MNLYRIIFMAVIASTYATAKEGTMLFSLNSNFSNMSELDSKYTAEGSNISPPLSWESPPSGTESFALIIDDPDAPDPEAPKMVFVHWILYNIPKSAHSLKEGASPSELPQGTLSGLNDYRKSIYSGPCPPIGKHRYFFKLYALSKTLPDLHQPSKKELEKVMQGSILGIAELIGTYKKKTKPDLHPFQFETEQ